MKDKLQQLIVELNKNLVGKEKVIKLSLLTMLAGENLILFGNRTAKSEIARRLSIAIDGDSYFEYLLTKFTTPEEIFGPLSIQELKADRFRRNVEGYMPNVKVAFLDEIFKANSSILNSLLTIINEKIYHNGNEKIKVPLQSLISASNELPIGDSELNALYDRFLVRKTVDYLENDEELLQLFDLSDEKFIVPENVQIKIIEIDRIREESKKINIPQTVKECILNIKNDFKNEFKNDNSEEFSDRRLVKVLKFLKVSAFTNGRKEVNLSDVSLLINCLWNNDENYKKIINIVNSNIEKRLKASKKLSIGENRNSSKKIIPIKLNETKIHHFKGIGTSSNPFIIENAGDLVFINDENYRDLGYYFLQTNDIDLKDIEKWESIGESENKYFSGHYNGNGFKITNLKGSSGLFGVVGESSSVINIGLEDVKISANTKVGGLININKAENIENCYVTGKISVSQGQIGGLIGENIGSDIRNCYSLARIEGDGSWYAVGGLLGINKNGNVNNSYASGDITGNSCVGGLIGHNIDGAIKKSYSTGKVCSKGNYYNKSNTSSSFSSYAGGVIGYNENGHLSECYNEGNVSGNIESIYSEYDGKILSYIYSGGIVGYNKNGIIENCYNLSNVESKSNDKIKISISEKWAFSSKYSGGITGLNEGMVNKCYYTGTKISSISEDTTSSSGVFGRTLSNSRLTVNLSNTIEKIYTGGIAGENRGKINDSVVSNKKLKMEGSIGKRISIKGEKSIIENCFAEQSIKLNDSNNFDSNINDENGKTIEFSMLNEVFYRRLGWDFEYTWLWKVDENRPILNVDINNFEIIDITEENEQKENIFKENIWL